MEYLESLQDYHKYILESDNKNLLKYIEQEINIRKGLINGQKKKAENKQTKELVS